MARKSKGIFLESTDYSILAAVVSGLSTPYKIEALHEIPTTNTAEEIRETIAGWTNVKGKAYTLGHVSCYPQTAFIRRHTLENLNKAKDPAYLTDQLHAHHKIDGKASNFVVVDASTGLELDLEKQVTIKEVAYIGADAKELQKEQDKFLSWGIFPERLELGPSVNIGAIKDYAKFKDLPLPTLVLEFAPDCSTVYILNRERLDVTRVIPYGLDSMFPVIQSELGLKDEESARKLFMSNTFDFTEMGPILLKKILKELQASIGFYEVQTGQTVGQIFVTVLPKNLNWIRSSLSRSLGLDILSIDFSAWLKYQKISVDETVQLESLDNRWLGLLGMMSNLNPSAKDGSSKES